MWVARPYGPGSRLLSPRPRRSTASSDARPSSARATASQVGKFDRATTAAAKKFVKPIPYEELKREIDIFCDLYAQPAVEEGLRKFVENETAQPYLP